MTLKIFLIYALLTIFGLAVLFVALSARKKIPI